MITEQYLATAMQEKQSIFLVSLKYREIVTVKTVALYEKTYFFIKSLTSKKKKLPDTDWQKICFKFAEKNLCWRSSFFFFEKALFKKKLLQTLFFPANFYLS